MSKILIAGGTGLVGSALTQQLLKQGHQVALLSRNPKKVKGIPAFMWDPMNNEIDDNCMHDIDYVINLAGAGIANQRWSKARKKLIIESRTKAAELLRQLFEKGNRPKKYIAASAIGFYGDRGNECMTEKSPAGKGFLSESVVAWEKASRSIATTGTSVNIIRIGIVLSTLGGALAKMLPSYSYKIGTYFGNGQQVYSWIHIADLLNVFQFLMEKEVGNLTIINAVAPHPVANKKMAQSINIAGKFGALILPTPSFAMNLALGEMSAVVLDSTHVSCEKLLNLGFKFDWPKIDSALVDIIENKH